MRFRNDICFIDHRRTNLLVAILKEFLLEGTERIDTGILSCQHLELVVDEQVDILINRFLVDDTLGIVFVVRIFKFGTTDRLTIDGHDSRVVVLSKSYAPRKEHSCEKRIKFHFFYSNNYSGRL